MIVIYAMIYLFCVFINIGFMLAYSQAFVPTLAQRDYRQDLVMSIGLSLFPTTWFVTPFWTGFYEHGWQIKRLK